MLIPQMSVLNHNFYTSASLALLYLPYTISTLYILYRGSVQSMVVILNYSNGDLASTCIKYSCRSALACFMIDRTYYVIIIDAYSPHSVSYNKVRHAITKIYTTTIKNQLF